MTGRRNLASSKSRHNTGSETLAIHGFTLVEILVVLALLAMSLSIAAPRIGNALETSRLKATSRALMATGRTARHLARNEQREVVLTVNVQQRSYRLDKLQAQKIQPATATVTIVGAQSEQMSLDETSIRFFPDGSSTGGRVSLSNDKMKFNVDFDWLTGAIAITQ
ncbi:MAG: general secretion pathway protein H [Gammaproteobacteria bacterium]|jgi:general secretion pathway protein H